MEKKNKDKILAFDSLFTSNRIQIFKILLAYIHPSVQKDLAIYIKLMELQYTLDFFQRYPHAVLQDFPHEEPLNSSRFFDDILPFCDSLQRDKVNQFKQTIQNFENMQEMMTMLEMMKDLFPQNAESNTEPNSTGMGNMDITQLLNMLSGGNMPDLSGMSDIMNMFSSFQTTNPTE